MRYIFENGNSNEEEQQKTNNSKYTSWMNSILRRSKEIVERFRKSRNGITCIRGL